MCPVTQNIRQGQFKHARISRRKRAVLPHLGNFFFGNIYHALTGNKRLPRALFKRAVANGLDREQLDAVWRQARDRDELAPLMLSIAENRLQQALYWHDVGVRNRARDNYLDAAFWEMYGSMLMTDATARQKALARARASYALAAPSFANPAEEIDIHYMGLVLKGYLRVPAPAEGEATSIINTNHPCAILFNGISTSKEEFYFTENSLLSLGVATFSFDYPFTNESNSMVALDADELGNALLLALSSRAEIDMSRLVAYGTSVGGRIALYVAARYGQRFRAVVSVSAPFDLLNDLDLLLPAMRREFAASQQCSKTTVFDIARQTEMRGELERIEVPALIVGGGKDIVAMPEETKTIYEQISSADKKLIICPGASHNCYEMMPSLRHEIAQWIKQRL
jgi:2,6-dihydroxypseudooxynicotine hydrolase